MYWILLLIGCIFIVLGLVVARKREIKSLPVIILFVIAGAFIIPINVVSLMHYRNIDGTIERKTDGGASYYHIVCNTDSRYDFGYLQGQALSQEILNMKIILSPMIDFIQAESREVIHEFDAFIPDEYREEMQGMAHGASNRLGIMITYDDILLQNLFSDLVYSRQIPQEHMGCSVVAYQSEDGVIAGQNFDFTKIMGYRNLFDTTAFVHTEFQGHEIFGLRMGGSLSIPMAKTHTFSVYINVVPSRIYDGNFSMPMFIRTRLALESATTLEEFETIMDFATIPASYNFVFANETVARGYETSPTQYHVNDSVLIVNTNTYMNSEMRNFIVDEEYSVARHRQVEVLSHELIINENFTEDALLSLFSYACEEIPERSIYREGDDSMDTITICFMTNSYFGFRNVNYSKGVIPI